MQHRSHARALQAADPSVLLPGQTEQHVRCREFDWASTSIGPISSWPSSLRAAVRLCLDSPLRTAVFAGPEHLLIYNDAYAATLGPDPHPSALGRPVRGGVRSGTPIREDDGRIVGAFHVVLELPERQREDADQGVRAGRAEQALRESEGKYRTLFDSIDEGFCIIEVLFDGDAPVDYRFVEVNPAFERQSGLQNATGRRMLELVPSLESHWFETYGAVATTGESTRFQNSSVPLDRHFDVYAFRVGPPEQRHVAVLFNDITERKRAEQALHESDRHKDDYLAMLGHELRNPLGAIRSATEVLNTIGAEDPLLQRTYAVLDRQSAHMARIMDGLLDISRIGRGKVNLELSTLDLRDVVDRVLEIRAPQIAAHGLELTLATEPLLVIGDDARLVQVLDNLIGNAIKFTPSPGHIHIRVGPERDAATIRVRDSGLGIRPALLSRIFEPFRQETQSLARSTGGLGLGLALAKLLVELHRGTIEAESAGPGTGAEFIVRLPLA